jgi:hypothetical protein
MFHTNRSSLAADGGNNQVSIDMVLKNCNAKLAQWNVTWEHEMRMGEEHETSTSIHYLIVC